MRGTPWQLKSFKAKTIPRIPLCFMRATTAYYAVKQIVARIERSGMRGTPWQLKSFKAKTIALLHAGYDC